MLNRDKRLEARRKMQTVCLWVMYTLCVTLAVGLALAAAYVELRGPILAWWFVIMFCIDAAVVLIAAKITDPEVIK